MSSRLLGLIKGGAAVATEKVIGTVVMFLLTTYIVDKFGHARYGEYAFFISTIKVYSTVALVGVDIHALKKASEFLNGNDWNMNSGIIGLSLASILPMSLVIYLGLTLLELAGLNILGGLSVYKAIVGLSICVLAVFKLINQVVRASGRPILYGYNEFISIPLITGLIVYLEFIDSSVLSSNVLIAHGLSILLTLCVTVLILNSGFNSFLRSIWNSLSKIKGSEVKANLSVSYHYMLGTIMSLLVLWVTHRILSDVESFENLGIYDIFMKVAVISSLPLIGLNAVIAPKLSQLHSSERYGGIRKLLLYSMIGGGALSVIIASVIYVFRGYIFDWFDIDAVAISIVPFIILLLSQVVHTCSGPSGLALQMMGRQDVHKNIVAVTGSIYILLVYFFIRRWGLTGAAAGYFLFVLFSNMFYLYYVYGFTLKKNMRVHNEA